VTLGRLNLLHTPTREGAGRSFGGEAEGGGGGRISRNVRGQGEQTSRKPVIKAVCSCLVSIADACSLCTG
jgi:hypothetical protein